MGNAGAGVPGGEVMRRVAYARSISSGDITFAGMGCMFIMGDLGVETCAVGRGGVGRAGVGGAREIIQSSTFCASSSASASNSVWWTPVRITKFP